MIENGTLWSITALTGHAADGTPVYGAAVELGAAGVRCFIGNVLNGQHMLLGSAIKDATRVMYVWIQSVKARGYADALKQFDQVEAGLDDIEEPATHEVVFIKPHVMGGLAGALTHYEIFLRRVSA